MDITFGCCTYSKVAVASIALTLKLPYAVSLMSLRQGPQTGRWRPSLASGLIAYGAADLAVTGSLCGSRLRRAGLACKPSPPWPRALRRQLVQPVRECGEGGDRPPHLGALLEEALKAKHGSVSGQV